MSTLKPTQVAAAARQALKLPPAATLDDIEVAYKHSLGLPMSATTQEVVARRNELQAAAAAPKTTSKPQIVTDDGGNQTFKGYQVRTNALGEPCVFTTSGWTQVSQNPSDEAMMVATAVMDIAPNGPTARAFRAGPGQAA